MSDEHQTALAPAAPAALTIDAKTAGIVAACGLGDKLSKSICLACARSVLAQDSKRRAILYCAALYRDIQIEIVDCTGFQSRESVDGEEKKD